MCVDSLIWAGLMAAVKIKAEDFPPCPGRTAICVDDKFDVQICYFLPLQTDSVES